MVEAPVGIITGGLGGIGAATALELASLGARLMLVDRSGGSATGLLEQVRAAGGEARIEIVDVRDAAAQQRVVERALSAWGRVDLLLANAGIAEQSRVATGDPERWRTVIETNLLGSILSCHAVLPAMLERDSGHIFVVSSVSGRESYVGEPIYIASKWGQVGFAHSLRLELLAARSQVRVTIIEPGLVDTPLTRGNPKVAPLLAQQDPLSPSDVARAVVYALQQPPHVVVSELTLRPLGQALPEL
jgi:NADP-dependent 3-hydroxy acid dehydrogenase YdfG